MSRASVNRLLHLLRVSIEGLTLDSTGKVSLEYGSHPLTQIFRVRGNEEIFTKYFRPLIDIYLRGGGDPTVGSFSQALTDENSHLTSVSRYIQGTRVGVGIYQWVEELVADTYHWLIGEALRNVASTYKSNYLTDLHHWIDSLERYNYRLSNGLPYDETYLMNDDMVERKIHEDGSYSRMMTALLTTPLGELMGGLLFYDAYEYIMLNTEVLAASLPEMRVMSETYWNYDSIAYDIVLAFIGRPEGEAQPGEEEYEYELEKWLIDRLVAQYGQGPMMKTDVENYLRNPENLHEMRLKGSQIRRELSQHSEVWVGSTGTARGREKRVRGDEMEMDTSITPRLQKRGRPTDRT